MAGAQSLEPFPLPSGVCIRGNVESGAELGIAFRNRSIPISSFSAKLNAHPPVCFFWVCFRLFIIFAGMVFSRFSKFRCLLNQEGGDVCMVFWLTCPHL